MRSLSERASEYEQGFSLFFFLFFLLMEKLTAVIYNDCEKVCLYLPIYVKTELFNPRNPYDTDLLVIEDVWELSYFSFFVFFWFGARRVDFFLLVVVVVGILSRDV